MIFETCYYAEMRDYQKSRVYAWCHFIENKYYKRISKNEVQQLIVQVLNDYEYCIPYAITHGHFKGGFYNTKTKKYNVLKYSFAGECDFGHAGIINIHPNMRNVAVVLHEVAHMLTHGNKHRDKFVAMLMDLYSYYMGIDIYWMQGLTNAYKVSYDFTKLPKRRVNSRKFRYNLAA